MNLFDFHLLCLLFISSITCYTVTDQIDFEKNCNLQMLVYDRTIAEVVANPQSGVLPETSSCQAKFVATPADRKLRIYFHDFFLGPGACGHKMKIYDGDPYQNDPKWEVGCNSELTTLTSSTNEIIISFVKPSVDTSQLYRFNLKITTDRAAPLTGDVGSSGGGLTSGAIAGIAIGCVVGAVIIIAICIYALWKFMRQAEEKKRYGAHEPPPVFVTSAPPLSNCGIPPESSRRSFRSRSHVAFSDISKKSEKTSSSSDGVSKSKSSKSYDNHGFSNDGTSVSSSHTKSEEAKDGHVSSSRHDKPVNREEFKRDKNARGSYRKDRKEENVNYPDVVDSARKSEKEKRVMDEDKEIPSKDTRSRSDSVKRSDRERDKNKDRSESVKRNEKDREKYRDRLESTGRDRDKDVSKRHKSRVDYEHDLNEKERGRYTDRDDRRHKHDKYQNDRHRSRSQGHRHKTESVYTDDSSATYLSSVSDRYHER